MNIRTNTLRTLITRDDLDCPIGDVIARIERQPIAPSVTGPEDNEFARRMLEKKAMACFRLGYINEAISLQNDANQCAVLVAQSRAVQFREQAIRNCKLYAYEAERNNGNQELAVQASPAGWDKV